MRILYTLLFLLSVTFAQAATILGGDIGWKCVGSDSFLVTLNLYIDCNFNQNFTQYLLIKDSLGMDSVQLSAASTKDVSNICASDTSRCASSASTFPYGMQKNVLTAIVDLSGYSGCNIVFGYQVCCRLDTSSSTSNQAFYIESSFNRCLAPCDNSPVFATEPPSILCAGECVVFSVLANDNDGDSLVYELTSPLVDSNLTQYSYSSPYSYDKPIYYEGFPNTIPPPAPSCKGFNLSSLGEFLFRPMKTRSAPMALKVEAYRNGVKIGETMRDMRLIIMNCPSNYPPVISGINGGSNFSTEACPDVTLSFTIHSDDNDLSDSVKIEVLNIPPGASFNVGTGRTPTSIFTWKPTTADARTAPYYLVVKATDQSCPVNTSTIRNYEIKVNPLPGPAALGSEEISCGQYKFWVDSTDTNQLFLVDWRIDGKSVSYAKSFTYQFDSAGSYPIQMKLITDCISSFYDTIVVGPVPKVLLPKDTTVCFGAQLIIKSQTSNTEIDSAVWNTGSHSDSLFYAALADTTFHILAYDTAGCMLADSVSIYVNPWPVVDLGPDLNVCLGSVAVLGANVQDPGDSIVGYNWYTSSSTATISDSATALADTTDLYILEVTDTLGCTGTDNVMVQQYLPTVDAGNDFGLCLGDSVTLSATPAGGIWSGAGISDSTFNSVAAGSGTHILVYGVIDSNACTNSDTAIATVHPSPNVFAGNDFTVCFEDSFSLNATPPAGTWSGAGMAGTIFYAAVAGAGNHRLIYIYSDSNACTDADTVTATVHPLSNIFAGNDFDLCLGDSMSLSATPAGGSWSGAGVSDTIFRSALAGAGPHSLLYSRTDSNACENSDTILATVHALPIAFAGNDTAICGGDTMTLAATGGSDYSWSSSPYLSDTTISNPKAFPADTTAFSLAVTDTNGCIATDVIVVGVDTQCVWPGDVNYDGVVNNHDLPYLGLANGASGTMRPYASNNWHAQPSQNWDSTFSIGFNWKHADCNGDQIVTLADTVAVSLNYMLIHNKRGSGGSAGTALFFSFSKNPVVVGDTVTAFLHLGSAGQPAEETYGLAFSFQLPAMENCRLMSTDQSLSWITQNGEGFDFLRIIQQQADIAQVRTNHTEKNDFGIIGGFQFEVVGRKDSLITFGPSNILMLNALGTILPVSGVDSILIIRDKETTLPKPVEKLQFGVHPNPAHNRFVITTSAKLNGATLISMTGKKHALTLIPAGNGFEADISNLPAGIYLLLINSEDNVGFTKVVVE